ncbi:ADP-ribosylation factor-like protein 5B [Chiloscyllium punctatum]|uniref:ADP-ribosylation factor-like protein 5B n=1 Tax=Chiloscyllium punctatum TaxID=137246 RepID=A0A401RS55_CHIPU|nr:hypothetical protein [Chiloscyllium punctatum]
MSDCRLFARAWRITGSSERASCLGARWKRVPSELTVSGSLGYVGRCALLETEPRGGRVCNGRTGRGGICKKGGPPAWGCRLGCTVESAASRRSKRRLDCSRLTVMGLLFSKLRSFFFDQEHKVIVVGLDNAGKTTILYQFLMNEVVHTSPTIGSNVEEIVVKSTHFLMWDIGGQESLRSSWNTYYTNTEFIILVVDSTDRERISVTKEELYRMLAHEDLRNAAVLIFANKQDKKCCMSAIEISKFLKLSTIKDHPWHIQACCALTGEGLCQGLEWMTTTVGVR